MFCKHCGSQTSPQAAVCLSCGAATDRAFSGANAKSRVAYVLLGVFLGTFGIHNFYAGYTGKAVTQLLLVLLLGWLIIPVFVVWIWSLVEICTVSQDVNGVPFS